MKQLILLLFFLFPVAARNLFHAATNGFVEYDDEPAPLDEIDSPLGQRRKSGLRGNNDGDTMRQEARERILLTRRSKSDELNNKVLDVTADVLEAQQKLEETPDKPGFDFIVAGFPKCGTTTLLKAFGAHDETDMASSEQCAIASPGQADAKVHKLLDGTLSTLSADLEVKRSFKCPTAMYNYKSLVRMEAHSPNTKFVVGMRHPVKMLQSFYNYRITEIRERGLDEPIPPLEEILETNTPWKGVSWQSTRFELFLMQMGKTDMSQEQLTDLLGQNYELAVKPTNFTVFLYTVDQLEDTDTYRSANLRMVMQNYLGLRTPIQPFGHENKNHATGKAAHAESISICDDKWASVRERLLRQGEKTAEWLRDSFIHSDDVKVANVEHFVQTLESWGTDPCIKKT